MGCHALRYGLPVVPNAHGRDLYAMPALTVSRRRTVNLLWAGIGSDVQSPCQLVTTALGLRAGTTAYTVSPEGAAIKHEDLTNLLSFHRCRASLHEAATNTFRLRSVEANHSQDAATQYGWVSDSGGPCDRRRTHDERSSSGESGERWWLQGPGDLRCVPGVCCGHVHAGVCHQCCHYACRWPE